MKTSLLTVKKKRNKRIHTVKIFDFIYQKHDFGQSESVATIRINNVGHSSTWLKQ